MSTTTTAGLDRETLDLIRDSIHGFALEHLPEKRRLELDENDEFPEELVRSMCGGELGIQLLFIPEEYEGMGGGAFDVYRVCETLARIDLGVATGVLATFLGSDPIHFGGTEEQKKHWMTRVAEEGLLMAYAATEPEAGSDLGALKSVAVPVEKNGEVVGYRLSGNKQWISNGAYADLYSFLARAPGGPSWFIIEKGAEGLGSGAPEDKHGIRASNTSTVTCDDVYVGADRLIGGVEGQGLRQAQAVFGYTRLMVAAFGLGAGWEALDRVVPYSAERVQAGAPLSTKQGYTHKLIVPHAVRLETARAFIEETAERIDNGEPGLEIEGAIAKYLATEAGNAATDAAIQGFGGYGYTREYMVEKIKRDVRITTIYEGTSEIMEMTVARGRWQEHLKTRGRFYHDQAAEQERLHDGHPEIGADVVALALHALADTLETARVQRLTRNQHVLFRLGALVAQVEGAASLARRAARAELGELNEKTDRRFPPAELAVLSRLAGREAAMQVALDGGRWVLGAIEGDGAAAAGEAQSRLLAILDAQPGLLADMDRVADALYDRV